METTPSTPEEAPVPQSTTEETAAPKSPAEKEQTRSVEVFELCTALLLGLGATLGSIAGYQGGLWSGISIEKYGESTRMTTKAADEGTFADSKISSDTMVKMQGIQLLARARSLPDGDERDLVLDQASELFIREYSTEAYESLELPEEPRAKYDNDLKLVSIPEKDLFDAGDLDFDRKYYDRMYEEKQELSAKARELFEEGRHANDAGDRFALNSVYYTLSLFFGGLGLVFRSRVRWGFFALGCVVLTGSAIYMFMLEWT